MFVATGMLQTLVVVGHHRDSAGTTRRGVHHLLQCIDVNLDLTSVHVAV
jgi:hypothetical protein